MSSVLQNLQYPGLEHEDDDEQDPTQTERNFGDETEAAPADGRGICSVSPASITTLTPLGAAPAEEGKDQQPVPPKRVPSVLSPYHPHSGAKGGEATDGEGGGDNFTEVTQGTKTKSDEFDYGYGSGSPDTAKLKVGTSDVPSPVPNSKSPPSEADLYGYGSGSPDVHKTKTAHQLQQELRMAAENMEKADRISSRKSNARGAPGAMLSQSMHNTSSSGSSAAITHHTYDRTRVPRRSSLKSSNSGRLSTLHERVPDGGSEPPARRGVSRHHSIDCSRSTMIEVRMRGERRPVQRKRSIDFSKTVQVKEVEPVTVLTEDIRDLWLQADDFAAMKEHRRSLLKKYKEAQALQEQQELERRKMSSQHQSSSSSQHPHTTKLGGGISFVKSCLRRSSGSHITSVTTPMELPAVSSSKIAGRNKHANAPITDLDNNQDGDDEEDDPDDKYSTPFKKKIVKQVMKGDDSFRGLEKYIDKSTRRNKNIGWDAVLLEQDEQGTIVFYYCALN